MDGDETEWGTVAWGLFCLVFPSSLSQNFSAMEILALFEAVLAHVSEKCFMCVTQALVICINAPWILLSCCVSDQKSALCSELGTGVSPAVLVLRLPSDIQLVFY